MFKVECPGCNAPYQVDERRVPASGLKMRCPKCGMSFQVDPPADARVGSPSQVLGAALGVAGMPKGPPRPPRRVPKATVLGVAGPAGGAVAPPSAGRLGAPSQPGASPSPVQGGVRPAPAAVQSELPQRPDDHRLVDLDLPTVGGGAPSDRPGRVGPGASAASAIASVGEPPAADSSAASQPAVGDLDLPALDDLTAGASAQPPILPAPPRPGGTKVGVGDVELDLGLPVVSNHEGAANVPSARLGSSAADLESVELDVPSPVGAAARAQPPDGGSGDIDLPEVAGQVGLPSVSGAAGLPSPRGELDLPSVGGAAGLPSPRGELDLPSVGGAAGLPSPRGELDLPSVGGGVELPSPRGELDLPSVGGAAGLPSPRGELDLPLVGKGAELASSGQLPSSAIPVGVPPAVSAVSATVPGVAAPAQPARAVASGPAAGGVAAAAAGALDAFGELELPTVGERAPVPVPTTGQQPALPVTDGRVPQPAGERLGLLGSGDGATAGAGLMRQSGGGTDYGEVTLEPSTGEVVLEAEVAEQAAPPDDDMEFGAIPQEKEQRPPAPSALDMGVLPRPAAVAPAAVRVEPPAEAVRGTRRVLKLTVAAVVALAVAGGALALVPSVGPFGLYLIEALVKGGEYRALVQQVAEQSRKRLALDIYPEAQRAVDAVERARSDAKRVQALSAYLGYVSYLSELRFGQDPKVRARAQVALEELQDAGEVAHLDLARAAREAASGRLARSRQAVGTLLARNPRDIDVLVLRGEVELRAREGKSAVLAWQAAAAVEKSARTHFGLARALHAGDDLAEAEKQSRLALKLSPGHVGARILLARIEWKARGGEQAAKQLLEAAKKTGNASAAEEVELQTLLGDIHLERSRISHAEAAYAEALKISPKAAGALRGLGEALYQAGRYTEALARFEAGAQADPDDVSAKVGVAKLLLALERLRDAKTMLVKLAASHPKSVEVAYWEGRAWEAVGDRSKAEAAYRRAIKHGDKNPAVVEPYVALAMLLNQKGLADDARRTLDEARSQLPNSPAIHKALGELALRQGRIETALEEYRTALQLDRDDVGARFWLGVSLRRNRQFEEAQTAFDEVAQVDRDYPGLALERGLLFEESGRSAEALKAYEAALAKAPNDPDLMLRVGCGQVAAGRSERAVELLRKVLASRSQSAETNHCLGRALLLEKNLAEALKKLERAVQLDPHRADYYLYVGWGANEAGDSLKAHKALKRALELDQGLADAYWQRGILAYRQGRVKDAVADLRRALELKPSRFEAHAGLAEAYDDLGMEVQALGEWRAAIQSQPDNAVWRFRFGKLLAANNNREAAQVQLSKALELAEEEKGTPRWAWQAHLLLARSIGARAEAVEHWEAYLRDAPLDDPYRDEAAAALRGLGKPWTGD